ncbi:MAG: hypothetical protein IPK15_20940, partial [Verrucomicrobia bacterium]|nr:hypothetical protein [Verrucomicrobiota bacterium]
MAEGVGTVTITALRSGATNTAVSVRFYATNGTAGATDYFTTNGILSFAANEVSKSFDLRIIDDALAENAETVILRLVSPTNATISGFGTNLVTIGTNDSAYVSWSVAAVSTNESTNAITLTVNRTGTTFNDVSVNFATTNVTALAAADYYATNGTLTLTNGQTTATIALRLLNDDLQESTETLQVRLSGVSDGIITNGTNTITITDDDVSTLAFATNAISTGESNVTLTVVVERSGATNTAVAVNYTTTNVTATAASDYTATSGTLSFVPGVVSNSFTVDVLHDLALETNETFQLRLSSATNSTLALGTNTVTITDNDAATVAFLHGSTNVAEGVGTVTITALRSGATNTAVSVRFYATNGTAGATDYFTTNGILSFAANEVSKSFDLRIIDDALAENAETVILRLVSPTNATISGFGTNLVTIGTNDSAYVSWSVASVSTNESTNAITLTVNRTGTTFNDVSVNFATTNVTALAAADYYATNGTLTLTNGQTTATIALRLLNDDLQESTETLQVRLSGVSDGIITNGTNTITITD